MKLLAQAIHTALRDDTVATIGMRALLGFSATPWGVFQEHFPDIPDFGNNGMLTWQFVSASEAGGSGLSDMKLRQQVFRVTAWSVNPDVVFDILKRAMFLLDNMRGVTKPTSDVDLHQIRYESSGPTLYDDKHKVYYRADTFRAYFRELITVTQ